MGRQNAVEVFQSDEATDVTFGQMEELSTILDQELAGCEFQDIRIGRRFQQLVKQLASKIGQPIPLACQDWANTKAAYRFLSNRRVNEAAILSGHFQATQDRAASVEGPILVLQDTTEFSYSHEAMQATSSEEGDRQTGGILMHSSLAVTAEGLPLGLAAIKFWTRSSCEGTAALPQSVSPTRMPMEQKESVRWLENLRQSTELLGEAEKCVHIGDRESDIYELFCAAEENGSKFLLRTYVDRIAEDGRHTISEAMRKAKVKATHRVEVRDANGTVSEVIVDVKYQRLRIHPPADKRKHYPPLRLTVIHAQESTTPQGREKLDWKLITNLSVRSRKDALEKLSWYGMRWKIETFHKILKSGCRAEDSKLRTAGRIVNLIAIFCLLSWRIFWMTMLHRLAPTASPLMALTDLEIRVLDLVIKDVATKRRSKPTLSSYLMKIARLGGYLAREQDSPPGNSVMWRGLSRLIDLQLGFLVGAKFMGN
jgi:Transposase DNA-binding